MATIAQNNIVREVSPKSLFESALPVLSTLSTFNQGDLIAYDSTNNIINAVTGSGSGANVLGVAPVTIVNGKTLSPYQGTSVDASAAIEDVKGPVYGVVAFLKLTVGDNWVPGQKAYIGADAQTVTSAVTGSPVGIFQAKAITSAASGQVADILIGCQYQQPGLVF
jgi:hypothetical protein